MGPPGNLPSGIKEQNRAGSSLRTFFFFRAQEHSFPPCEKSGKESRRPAWLSSDLLVKQKCKKEMPRQ